MLGLFEGFGETCHVVWPGVSGTEEKRGLEFAEMLRFFLRVTRMEMIKNEFIR